MSTPVELRTARLVLRQWRDDDRDPWAELNADPLVMEHFPATLDRASADRFVDRCSGRIAAAGWGLWALAEARSGRFLGMVGLLPVSFRASFTPAVEVGWRLRRDAWGHGYATEAARAAVGYGFDDLGLDEIVSFTVPANVRSRAVMERLGMRHDASGDFDHPNLPADSPLRRHVLYRLAAPDGGRR